MLNSRGLLFYVFAAWLIAAPAAVRAEEPRRDQDEAKEQPRDVQQVEYIEVNVPFAPTSNTIATKLPVPLQLTPANVGVVSAALFNEQNAQVLGDTFHNVSGVSQQSGSGVHDYFVIRGFNSLDGSLVLTDGAAEPEVTYYPLYNVEGVEVFKGPTGFLYGSNPLAGTVNMIRKQPLPGNFLNLGGSLGSFGTVQGDLDWNLADSGGDLSFRLNAMWRESDNYRDNMDSEHFAVNPSLTWKPSDNSKLNVNLEYVDASYSPDSGLPLVGGAVPDVPRRRSYQSPFDFSDQTISRYQVDYEIDLSDRLTLRNKLYHRDLEWISTGTLLTGMISATETSRTLNALDDRQKSTGNQFELIYRAQTGAVSHTLLGGIEISRYTDDFNIDFLPPPFMPSIDVFNPVETLPAGVPLSPFLRGDSTVDVIAPYFIDQMGFGEKFQLMIGGRYDEIDSDVVYDVHLFDPLNPGYERSDGNLSPMGGFVYAPNQHLSVYFNAGESYAPIGARVTGAATLDPEKSNQYEIGVKKKFLDGKMHTTFAIYQIDRENIAIPDDNGITQQAGDQRSQGFEFELAAEPREGLRTFFTYAYNDAELTSFAESLIVGIDPMTGFPINMTFDRSGNVPAFAPEHLASLWISKTFNNGFGVGGGPRYIDDQFIAEDNVFALDSVLLVDAALFYDFSNARIKLNLMNISDEEYETRGFGSTSVIPGNPFSVAASFEYRF